MSPSVFCVAIGCGAANADGRGGGRSGFWAADCTKGRILWNHALYHWRIWNTLLISTVNQRIISTVAITQYMSQSHNSQAHYLPINPHSSVFFPYNYMHILTFLMGTGCGVFPFGGKGTSLFTNWDTLSAGKITRTNIKQPYGQIDPYILRNRSKSYIVKKSICSLLFLSFVLD